MTTKLLEGDCRAILPTLDADSVHCVVTSPPYYGLRDYGVAGQLGLEATPDEYIQMMVAVFREVKRVLRPDGTCWVNIGDSYNNFRSQMGPGQAVHGRDDLRSKPAPNSRTRGWDGLKEKDLLMIPARLALALQADGWWLRSDVIWSKPNPMPESVTDRPTNAHEHVFLLTKSARYYYDADAVREKATKAPMPMQASAEAAQAKSLGPMQRGNGINHQFADPTRLWAADGGRNLRNVWTIATHAFPEAHFATMPSALAERCIKAGCPVDGTVLDPFAGAGTTGLVADRLQRDAVLIELNPDYCAMLRKRIVDDCPLFVNLAAD